MVNYEYVYINRKINLSTAINRTICSEKLKIITEALLLTIIFYCFADDKVKTGCRCFRYYTTMSKFLF